MLDTVMKLNLAKEETLTQELIAALESTGNRKAQQDAEAMKKAKREGKNALQCLGDNMKAVSNIVTGGAAAYKAIEYAPTLMETLSNWIQKNVPVLMEIIQKIRP